MNDDEELLSQNGSPMKSHKRLFPAQDHCRGAHHRKPDWI